MRITRGTRKEELSNIESKLMDYRRKILIASIDMNFWIKEIERLEEKKKQALEYFLKEV